MPRLAANLSMLFCEHDFLQRFEAAAKAGFKAVEIQFPYAYQAEQIRAQLKSHGLQLVLHNLPAGNWDAGERGIACHPDRVQEFQDGVAKAIAYATALGTPQLNCLAGIQPPEVTEQQARNTLVSNLRYAATELSKHNLRLLIEPINTADVAGFFLCHTQQALDIIDAVGAPNLFLQYDVYHMQRMEGDLANHIKTHLPRIQHLQIADNPGRAEPGTGEINYHFLLSWLDQIGYDGWVGCEYKPKGPTLDGLAWMPAHGL